jgi:hypothetical protein
MANDIVSVSARLLDMSDIRLSDHVVTPLFAHKQLPPPEAVNAFTPFAVGSLVHLRQSGRLAVVHRVWRRGPTMVLEVLRVDGRVETCHLDKIDSYYPVERPSSAPPCLRTMPADWTTGRWQGVVRIAADLWT